MGLVAAVLTLALALTGCAGNAKKVDDGSSFSGTVWSVADVTVDGNTYTVDEMIEHNLDAPGITRLFEFIDDANSCLLVVADGKVLEVKNFDYQYNGESFTFESDDIIGATFDNNSLSITFVGGNVFRFVKTDLSVINPTIGTTVTSLPETTNEPAYVDTTPSNNNGKYTYHIDGQDWSIGIKIEDLIHDGQIDASDLHLALGFDRTGDLRDSNNAVIAKSVGFLAGAKQGPYDTVTVFGNVSQPDNYAFFNFMSNGSSDEVVVVAGNRSFRVTLNQLVVAIYGCEQYADGEIHGNVYGNMLENYASGETYYLIP